MLVIVPNSLRNAILTKIDEQLAEYPELASHRDDIYGRLLAYYDEHGTIPEFTLRPSPQP